MKALRLKQRLREQSWMQPIRLANLKWRQRHGLFPEWRALLGADWQQFEAARDAARVNANAPRVLLATGVGIHAAASSFDSYLAVALTARGARCDVLLCDAALPACMAADYTWYPDQKHFAKFGSSRDLCKTCFDPAQNLFGAEGLGFAIHRYGSLLESEDRARARSIAAGTLAHAIETLKVDGIAVGEAALSGALRFLARGQLEMCGNDIAILRRYLEAACLALFAVRRLLSTQSYDVIVGHHGIYVPQGLVAAAAKQLGVRFVTWNPAYRAGCFILSHDETYHYSMMTEPTRTWENISLTDVQTDRLMRYLADRAVGAQDWISFHPSNAETKSDPIVSLGLGTQ